MNLLLFNMLRYKLIKKLHVSLQDIPVVFLYCDPLQFLQDVSFAIRCRFQCSSSVYVRP